MWFDGRTYSIHPSLGSPSVFSESRQVLLNPRVHERTHTMTVNVEGM